MTQTTPRRRPSPRRKANLTASQVVADQIKDRREKRNLSQQELAKKISESQSTVARIESGRRTITVDDVFKIAWALDVAPVHLLGAGFRGDAVPVTSGLQLDPVVARAWIRGKTPLRDGDHRAFLFENIPDDEAQELFSAARNRERLETLLSLVELAVAGKVESVDLDPHEMRSKLKAMLEQEDDHAS